MGEITLGLGSWKIKVDRKTTTVSSRRDRHKGHGTSSGKSTPSKHPPRVPQHHTQRSRYEEDPYLDNTRSRNRTSSHVAVVGHHTGSYEADPINHTSRIHHYSKRSTGHHYEIDPVGWTSRDRPRHHHTGDYEIDPVGERTRTRSRHRHTGDYEADPVLPTSRTMPRTSWKGHKADPTMRRR